MDFLDPKKKRAHTLRLFIGYALMAVALIMASVILVLEAYGFNIDRHTGSVIQNGLVFFDSKPGSASIYIDNELKGRTDARMLLPGGRYEVELRREGYRSWRKNLALDGGGIERLVYPLLIPQNLSPKEVKVYDTPPQLLVESPDRRWLLVQQAGQFNSLDAYDITQASPVPVQLALPKDLFTNGSNRRLELIEWSGNSRHVLLKHVFDAGFEYVIIDRENPSSSQNITKTLAVNPEVLRLRDKKFDQYYMLQKSGAALQQIDLKTKQPVAVADKVIAFKTYGSSVLTYVSIDGSLAGTASVMVRKDQDVPVKLRELPVDSEYLVDISLFDNSWYVVVGAPKDQKVYIFKDVFDQQAQSENRLPVPVTMFRLDTIPEFVSFSTNSRFIAVQSGSRLAVYDAENARQFRYDTKLLLPPGKKIQWMDGHRLSAVSAEVVTIFEFDGMNVEKLTASTYPGIFFDKDYSAYFTLASASSTEGRSALFRTSMQITQ